MKKIIIAALLLASQAFCLMAQDANYTFRFTYDVAIPTGKFSRDYISKMSWRGIGFDNRWAIAEDYSIGFYLGWQVFYEQKSAVTQTNRAGDITATGDQFRFVNTWPIQLTGHKYFADEEAETRLWVGLAAGTAYSQRQTDLGLFSFVEKDWSFALTPTAGVDFKIGLYSALTMGLRYNWTTVASADFDYTYLNPFLGFRFIPN